MITFKKFVCNLEIAEMVHSNWKYWLIHLYTNLKNSNWKIWGDLELNNIVTASIYAGLRWVSFTRDKY